ncbi:MAG TPA: hypothetical protein VNE39_18720 [Planctomycetota bacterium]|nr:hypothetical protein [Planctomycetota bacterium]
MARPSQKLVGLALIAALCLGGFAVHRLWDFTCDDSFITLRYSRHLAEGLGPTYNATPPRAEGYTSFLWMLLAAVPHALRLDAVAAAKAMGVAATLLTLAACYATAWSLCEGANAAPRAFAASLAALLFAVYPFTPPHAVSGMDTALAGLALCLLALAATRGSPRLLACCALAAGLTRPELNLAVVAVLLARLALLERGQRRGLLIAIALFYVLPGAAYFAWRWAYYGAFLPLPFYVKAASLEPRGLAPALAFALEMAAGFGLLLAVAAANLSRKCLPLLAAIGVMGLYLLLPEPVMAYGHRLFHPLVPLFAVLTARGSVLIFSAARERLGERKAAALYVGLAAVALAAAFSRYDAVRLDFAQYAHGMRNAHVRLGTLLAPHATEAGAVLAIADAGAVPYYSRWETVDTFGLNDPHIARTGDHSAAYVFSREPTVVVLLSFRRDVFQARLVWEQGLYRECLRRGLGRAAVLEFSIGYYLWVMARLDGPVGRRLASELSAAP